MESLVLKIALIGAVGIGAQWISWRFRAPAIVVLVAAGLIIGPLTGYVDPYRDFSELLRPIVAVAVAIILFEGGLTLNFHQIRQTSRAVRQLILIGAPLGWLLGSLAAHYVAGLSWQASAILGGIFVVTGPTVITPLLRQARLSSRPASLLRWEAIVNDPVGALFAVMAYEAIIFSRAGHSAEEFAIRIGTALAVALIGGYITGKAIVEAFNRGWVPEFLKAPMLLVVVLAAYAGSQLVLEESGLLTVTVMGLTIGNSKLASLDEIKRFKEIITVLLVSGIFILLTATIDAATVAALDWRAMAYVAVMLFLVRPLTTWTATIGSGLTWQERTLIGWIAPRGVVAIAVASFFATAMADIQLDGGRKMVALAFALVMTTVILHGFTLRPLARRLGLASAEQLGVILVGGNSWTTGLAGKLKELKIPVLLCDSNWNHLRAARDAGVPTYYGEILSEAAEHSIDFNIYGVLVAATDNDAYNTLVCTNFGYEFGRQNIFQLQPQDKKIGESGTINFRLGGKPFLSPQMTYAALMHKMEHGEKFYSTRLSKEFDLADLRGTGGEGREPVLAMKTDGELVFAAGSLEKEAEEGMVVVNFG